MYWAVWFLTFLACCGLLWEGGMEVGIEGGEEGFLPWRVCCKREYHR